MKYTRIDLADGFKSIHGYTYWISGIYKIVAYGNGFYDAYFIQEWAKNWGDYVEPPPVHKNGMDGWLTLQDAKQAIKRHAKSYTASNKTVKRAAVILDALIEKHSAIAA